MNKKLNTLILTLFICSNLYGLIGNFSEILIEGEIEFISKLPNPKNINYPDCNYSTIIKIHNDTENTFISVVFKGIENREILTTAKFRVGDKVRVTLIPFENADAKIRQTQLVDQVDDFDIKVYYAIKVKKIKEYSKNIGYDDIPAKTKQDDYISIVSKDQKSSRIRNKKIKSEIKRIEKLLKSHGGTWEQWEDDIKEFKIEYAKATVAKESKWVDNSFFSAGIAYAEQNEGNFVEAMTQFNTYLKQFNIDLIIIRIPFKGEVSGEIFSNKLSDHVVNPYAMKVTLDLLKNDIEVLDILPKLIKDRKKYPLLFWYNDFEETHPAEAISWIVAKELKKLLLRYPEYENMTRIQTSLKDTIGFSNKKQYKWPKGNKTFDTNNFISYKTVVDSLGNILQLQYDKNTSPFLLIGNSFLAYPSIERGGSIPHYFTHKNGFMPDVYYRIGGVGLGRLIYKKGLSFLENRRTIVYIALPQSFQGNVPVIPLNANINKNDYTEKTLVKLDKNNWNKHVIFIPETTEENILYIQNGYICATGKEIGKSDGGEIIVTIPGTEKFKKNEILKINFEFKSIGHGTVLVNYDGKQKSFLRSNNSNDDYFETIYFKLNKKTSLRNFKISFRGLKEEQLIKEINVSLLRPK